MLTHHLLEVLPCVGEDVSKLLKDELESHHLALVSVVHKQGGVVVDGDIQVHHTVELLVGELVLVGQLLTLTSKRLYL